MQLLYEVKTVLRSAGFRVAQGDGGEDQLEFEDDTILGFVGVHASVTDLVTRWREQQDTFLRTHAAKLRRDPSKAWNAYAILLTDAPVEDEGWKLLGVESDLAATRKIVRGGIITSEDLRAALAPVLPLAAVAGVGEASTEASFAERLGAEESTLFALIRDKNVDDRGVVTWLLEGAQ